MSSSISRPFTTDSNYTKSDTSKIAASGGLATLLLGDNTGLTFEEAFSSSANVTIDDIDNAVVSKYWSENTVFYAPFTTDLNAEYTAVNGTGVALNGAAIVGNELDLSGGTAGRAVRFTSADTLKYTHRQFKIRLKGLKPNYTGTPANQQHFIDLGEWGSNNNLVSVRHRSADGKIQIALYNSAGSLWAQLSGSAAWAPTAGQAYDFEVNVSIDNPSKGYIHIDGVNYAASSSISAGFYTAGSTDLVIGTDMSLGTTASDFKVTDVIIEYTPDHLSTDSFTPSDPTTALIPKLGINYWTQLGATYLTSIDASFSEVSTTAIEDGTPVITGGVLDCTGDNGLYYDAVAHTKEGGLRVIYRPNYNLATGNLDIFGIKESASNNNQVRLYHAAGGDSLRAVVYDSSGVAVYGGQQIGGSPAFTAGQDYELYFTWDSLNGVVRLFIDGVLHGTLSPGAWTMDPTTARLHVGASVLSACDAFFSNLLYNRIIEYTSGYTAGYTVPSARYLETFATIDQFTYSGSGDIQALTNFSATVAETPKFILDDLYYSGGWIAASNTYATATTIADIVTNIATFPNDTTNLTIKAVLPTANAANTVNTLVATYTGQIYPTDNPWIKFNETTEGSEIVNFVETDATETGSDLIKYAIEIDGSDYYVTGGTLTASDGYTKTNTAAEIVTNKALFLTGRSAFRVKAYLHSDDGSTTPTLSQFTVTYDASLPDVSPTLIDVNGFLYLADGVKASQTIRVRPYQSGFVNEGVFYIYEYKTVATTDSDGFWSGNIAKNPAGTYWDIKIGRQPYKITLESESGTSVDFAELDPELIDLDA